MNVCRQVEAPSRYLEDIVSRTRYRPSRAHNRWNKQSKTRHSEVQAQLKSKGLGDDDANAIATLEAEDNVDYGVCSIFSRPTRAKMASSSLQRPLATSFPLLMTRGGSSSSYPVSKRFDSASRVCAVFWVQLALISFRCMLTSRSRSKGKSSPLLLDGRSLPPPMWQR